MLMLGKSQPKDGKRTKRLLAIGIDSLKIELIDSVRKIDLQREIAVGVGDYGRPSQFQVEGAISRKDEPHLASCVPEP